LNGSKIAAMTTYLAALLILLLLALVVGLLERTKRRSADTGLPHAPFGADGRRDADLGRLLHDLDAHRW
jgi:hypothetical protein